MARAKVDIQKLATFENGLITEATRLFRPENSFSDGDNIDLTRKGEAVRRKGLALEQEAELSDFAIDLDELSGLAINEYDWLNVNGSTNKSYYVLQVGSMLYLYDLLDSAPSSAPIAEIDMIVFATNATLLPLTSMDFAAGQDYLFVANPYMNTAMLFVDSTNNTLKGRAIYQYIRDFDGVDDAHGIDFQPTVLSVTHKYNLINQGWVDTTAAAYRYPITLGDVIPPLEVEEGEGTGDGEIIVPPIILPDVPPGTEMP